MGWPWLAAQPGRAASTQRGSATLIYNLVDSLGPTGPGRCVDAAPFRLTKSAVQLRSACCDQEPLRLLDYAAI